MSQWEYDVVTTGGEVTGCAAARELSRYELRVCVMEWGGDVRSGTSRANSAIVHVGYDVTPGTREAELNVARNAMMGQLSKDLNLSSKRNDLLMLYFTGEEEPKLRELYEWGVANEVPGIRLTTGGGTRSTEPDLTDEVIVAIYAPSSGIVCPLGLTTALAGNAYENRVELHLFTEVERIEEMESGGYGLIIGHEGTAKAVTAHYVVNAAGVYADTLHNTINSRPIHIAPGKDDYCLLDKGTGGHVTSTIFQLPGVHGKGVLVTPTVHGNLLVSPTATDIGDRENVVTTAEGLTEIINKSIWSVKNIPHRQVITSFTDLRTYGDGDDSVIGEAEGTEGFYNVAGAESPGLSYAPTTGVYLAELIADAAAAGKKEQFIVCRKGIPHLDFIEKEGRARLIKERLDYEAIICRCENVSKGRIMDTTRCPPGATSLDGIKRRVRQDTGRCQAGFYAPRTMEILARELRISMEDICKNAPGSQTLTGINRGEKR